MQPHTPESDPLPIVAAANPPRAVAIRPPGSKSETNRQLILAALAQGTSTIRNPLRSDDCDCLVIALQTLGTSISEIEDRLVISGVNGTFPAGGTINLNYGGTPTRFMIAASCLAAHPVTVD